MFPSVWPGDILIVQSTTAADVRQGDILLYKRNSRLFAHRVVKKNESEQGAEVLTRGDAMQVSDPVVLDQEVLGRIRLVVRNGRKIEPRKSLTFWERVSAALFMHSEIVARVIVEVHGLRRLLPASTV